MLVNLIANAAKLTPSGGKVRVTAHADPEAWTMALAVGDTGKGIPPQDRARIFELFTQVEDHSPERRQGTGLGLAFCKMAVEAHGGTITVDSEEGRGSTFTVTLPLAPEKEQRRD